MVKTEGLGLTDRLTGLKNYDCFVEEFEKMVKEAEEKNEDLALAMIDIDRFMSINQEFGHSVGDIVIKEVGKHIMKNAPDRVELYRYSGDEYALLLPNTEKEAAFLMMENIRATFSLKEVEGASLVDGTISVGIASIPEDGTRMTELVRKAEGALFRAKKAGRNKVCLSREEKMITKTSHYTYEQLQRLSELAKKEGMGEAILLREALDDLLKKYDY